MKKICIQCKNKKDIHLFFNDKSRKDGKYPKCKECYKSINRRSSYSKKCEICNSVYTVEPSRLSTSKFCSVKCRNSTVGQSKIRYRKCITCSSNFVRRKDNWFSEIFCSLQCKRKSFKSPLNKYLRYTTLYKIWRTDVFKRDGFKCLFCDVGGKLLQADHIIPFALLINSENLKTIEDAEKSNILWDINNGRTLCVECHKKTDTYGSKTKMLCQSRST